MFTIALALFGAFIVLIIMFNKGKLFRALTVPMWLAFFAGGAVAWWLASWWYAPEASPATIASEPPPAVIQNEPPPDVPLPHFEPDVPPGTVG